jgi:predicted RNA-binding Zn-ribbon protein involved in translation (DUF1610 family)
MNLVKCERCKNDKFNIIIENTYLKSRCTECGEEKVWN